MERESFVSVDPYLRRLAQRLSNSIGKEVEAAQIGDDPPFFFVARELLVGSAEHDVLARCAAEGGELFRPRPIPPQPPELARTRQPRAVDFPRPVTVRISPRRSIQTDAEAVVRRARHQRGDPEQLRVKVSTAEAITLAGLALELETGDHDVSLNYVGEPAALKLKSVIEDPGHPLKPDATQWPWIGAPTRIVEAWQLFESYRSNRAVQQDVWIAIFDNGFWLDQTGVPFAADLANCSPVANLIDNSKPLGGMGDPKAPWHGSWVASCALGLVGNKLEAAGSGGLIASGALFRTSYSWKEAIDGLVIVTVWGVDIVNMSYGGPGSFKSAGERDSYNKAFEWAASNNVIVVVSAGNNGLEIPQNDVRPAANTPGVITCGNVDHATWQACVVPGLVSNYGSAVDIWAPGTNITVAPDGTMAFPSPTGTSLSAPLVAGVIAMMRAIKPSMKVEEARSILRDTAWPGNDGRATHILDAYRALLLTINSRLPDEFEEWSSPGNNSAATAALLAPIGGDQNRLGPIGGVATHNIGDHDWWRFSLTTIRSVDISLEWYHLLGDLNVLVEPADAENGSVDDLRTVEGAGTIRLSGVLGPGGYRVRVTGAAITAYEISVRLRQATLLPDEFEPNGSFDFAAPLLFHTSQRDSYAALDRPWWGPGTFNATLNWRAAVIGSFVVTFVDVDYYLLDGRVSIGLLERFCTVSRTDEPIDITLYDKDRQVVATWPQSRGRIIKLEKPQVYYLGLQSKKPTRYLISTSLMFDPAKLPHDVEMAEVFPEWWGKNPFVKAPKDPAYYMLKIGHGDYDVNPDFEPQLAFEDLAREAMIVLLDPQGHVVGHAEEKRQPAGVPGSMHTLTVAGLPPGTSLRISRPATTVDGRLSRLRLPPAAPNQLQAESNLLAPRSRR